MAVLWRWSLLVLSYYVATDCQVLARPFFERYNPDTLDLYGHGWPLDLLSDLDIANTEKASLSRLLNKFGSVNSPYYSESSLGGIPRVSGLDFRKRGAVWQPMGGPLPVDARFAAFGSQIQPEPGRGYPDQPAVKTMRYGK